MFNNFSKMVIEVGFCVEGRLESELPELLLGCVQMDRPNYERAVPWTGPIQGGAEGRLKSSALIVCVFATLTTYCSSVYHYHDTMYMKRKCNCLPLQHLISLRILRQHTNTATLYPRPSQPAASVPVRTHALLRLWLYVPCVPYYRVRRPIVPYQCRSQQQCSSTGRTRTRRKKILFFQILTLRNCLILILSSRCVAVQLVASRQYTISYQKIIIGGGGCEGGYFATLLLK